VVVGFHQVGASEVEGEHVGLEDAFELGGYFCVLGKVRGKEEGRDVLLSKVLNSSIVLGSWKSAG
jgi:hypothetical protein